jgi:DNA-binding transcriptional MerR regulator
MAADARYGIEELADLGGVSRRTVRYYVQEELLPAPLGKGRGRHYGPEHLERLLRVKGLQEQGLSLGEVRSALAASGKTKPAADGREPQGNLTPARSAWARLQLVPGVELHVSSGYRLPSPARLRELASWCQLHLRREEEGDA